MLLCLASALLGSVVVPLLPIVTENCAEVTYPISEDISVGILLVGGNYVGILITFMMQWLLSLEPLAPPPFLPSSIFVVLCLIVAASGSVLYKGDYKRYKADMDVTNNTALGGA